jgi:hypothetical protein
LKNCWVEILSRLVASTLSPAKEMANGIAQGVVQNVITNSAAQNFALFFSVITISDPEFSP